MIWLLIFLWRNGKEKKTHKILSMTALAVIIFILTNVFGVSTYDHELSRILFLGSFTTFFISILFYHLVIILLDIYNKRRLLLYSLYIVTIFISIWIFVFPDIFITVSKAKLYFPNYYVFGKYFTYFSLFFHICVPILSIGELVIGYLNEKVDKNRKKIKYLGLALSSAWANGAILLFLVYDIQIDPKYGVLFPVIFCIPFILGVIRYNLLDIKIVAKKALYYGILTAISIVILIFLNFLNKWMEGIVPFVPIWTIPFISSLSAMILGMAVWKQISKIDFLRYNFMNKNMHSMRTPLTHIKISVGLLKSSAKNIEHSELITIIEDASEKLLELTDLNSEKLLKDPREYIGKDLDMID
jgi:signal transduction histidine kinase